MKLKGDDKVFWNYKGEIDSNNKACGNGELTSKDIPNFRYTATFLNDEIHGICVSTSEITIVTAEYRRGKVFGKQSIVTLNTTDKQGVTMTES